MGSQRAVAGRKTTEWKRGGRQPLTAVRPVSIRWLLPANLVYSPLQFAAGTLGFTAGFLQSQPQPSPRLFHRVPSFLAFKLQPIAATTAIRLWQTNARACQSGRGGNRTPSAFAELLRRFIRPLHRPGCTDFFQDAPIAAGHPAAIGFCATCKIKPDINLRQSAQDIGAL